MLTVIAILATSLSSPYLGTFFQLPNWMGQASVESARTYGSPDATNATHRIDATALRAVNAIFEGWAERCYYVHEGPSNVWNEAVYGPTAKPSFAFSMPSGYYATRPAFVWDPDTNRVANAGTRRFVEYGHLRDLALAIADPEVNGIDIDEATAVDRPLWRPAGGVSWFYDGAPVWSSTLFDGIVPGQLPTFGWSAPGTALTPEAWQLSAPYWGFAAAPQLTPDWYYPEFSWHDHNDTNPQVFANSMLWDVHWGENPSPDDYCPPWPDTLTNTTEEIISRPYAGMWQTWDEARDYDVVVTQDEMLYEGSFAREVEAVIVSMFADLDPGEVFRVEAVYDGPVPAAWMGDGWYAFRSLRDIAVTRLSTGERIATPSSGNFFIALEGFDCDPSRATEVTRRDASDVQGCPCGMEAEALHMGFGAVYVHDLRPTNAAVAAGYDMERLSYPVTRSNSVCKVHGVGTNDTRRLVTDQVAGLGQCLSALDRSYARMDASVDEGIEASYYRVIDYESDPQDVTPVYFEGGIGYVDGEIMFSGFHVVGGHTNHSTSAVGNRRHIYAGCSRTTTLVGGGPVGQSLGQWIDTGSYEDIRRVVITPDEEAAGQLKYDRYINLLFIADPSNPDGFHHLGYAVDQNGHAGVTTPATYVPVSSNIPNVVCVASYSRSYSYGRTRLDSFGFRGDEDDRQILYPGSADRVREATLWHLGSRLREAGSESSTDGLFSHYVNEIPERGKYIEWSVQQRAGKDVYADPDGLSGLYRTMFYELLTDCDNWVSSAIGVGDYRIPTSVVPMSPGDVSFDGKIGFCRVGDKVPVCKVTMQPFNAYVRMPKDGGPGEGKIFIINPDGTEVERDPHDIGTWIYLSTVEGGWGEDVPPEERRSSRRDSYGARANVKVSGLSRVDWAWGALRRED